jgi:hypothetical protein
MIESRGRSTLSCAIAAVALLGTQAPVQVQAATANEPRAVVELFTSLGCSSCPPADALVGSLSANPGVLALSFHVTYWDDLGWPDPYASKDNTERQYAYAHALQESTVFTPQLLVNGTQSLVGSQSAAVQHAVAAANQAGTFPVHAQLAKQANGGFTLTLAGSANKADVWELRYVRRAVTRIGGGENGGRTLATYNNVTHIRRLGSFTPGTLNLAPLKSPEDGLAILVQAPDAGRVLGAAALDSSQPPGS